MIDRYDTKRFEDALPTDSKSGEILWTYLGMQKGERVYSVPVRKTNKRIIVRSSIDRSGLAAETGEDSIRHWIEYLHNQAWKPLDKGHKKYTTRVNGWEERLTEALRELYTAAVQDSQQHNKYGDAFDVHANEEQDPHSAPPHAEPQSEEQEEQSFYERLLADKDAQPPQVEEGPAPNPEQRAAIEADIHKPLRILAPPGAGKTFVLSHRYSYMLSQGVNPSSIVAVTFNRDMADELLARIVRVNADLQRMQLNDPEADPLRQITTIHALCYRILKAEGDRRSVPGFRSRVKHWEVKQAVTDIIEILWPVAHYRPSWKEVLDYIDHVKFLGLSSASDMEFFGGIRDKWDRLVERQLHEARRRFDEWCKRNRVITFADMLYDVEQRLLNDKNFRHKWQQRFEYIIIDEGQDTSSQAMRILTTLSAPQNQITIVGDTDQLLYRFAGATPEANLYDGFENRYPDAQTVFLKINYRSTQVIVDACSRVIQHNYRTADNPHAPYDVKYLKDVEPRPDAPEGDPIQFTTFTDAVEEAQGVVQQIQELLQVGYEPGDIFIGSRTRAQTGFLEGPLVQAGIPYINLVGSSFFGQKHITDVVSYMRLAYDQSDNEAFENVFNIGSVDMTHPWGRNQGEYCHHRYLGKAFLQACTDADTGKPQYKWIWAAVKKRKSYMPGVKDLDNLVTRIQGVLAHEKLDQVIEFILEECYVDYLQQEEGLTNEDASQNGKLDDFETLKELASRFESASEFFEYVANAEAAAEAAKSGSWSDHVVLSTVHRLKGQERKVVFGVGVGEGYTKTTGLPVGLLPHTYSMRAPSQHSVLPSGGKGRIEDERDVFFVLVSRAKERVFLSMPREYHKMELEPSRFIHEMLTD